MQQTANEFTETPCLAQLKMEMRSLPLNQIGLRNCVLTATLTQRFPKGFPMHISSCDGCGVALKRMSHVQRNAYCAFQHLMQISENFKFSNSIRKQQSYDNESKADFPQGIPSSPSDDVITSGQQIQSVCSAFWESQL